MNSLAITICSTEKYSYAVNAQAFSVQSAIFEYINVRNSKQLDVSLILVSDGCSKMRNLAALYQKILSSSNVNLKVYHEILPDIKEAKVGYKSYAQKLIAKLRSHAFLVAKRLAPDFCLSLDSDILIKANSLIAMEDTLNFDNSYYSVVMANYPSQGGGPFLGGRGSFTHRIAENVYGDEKNVPKAVSNRLKKLAGELDKLMLLVNDPKTEDKMSIYKKIQITNKKISFWHKFINKKIQPHENVFQLNGKRWRQRGWFDYAYPGIGKGSIVPTDWTGFGCLLINKKALNYIDFHGYIGEGTEDLFINWDRWYPNGIKMACLPHCPADHVIRRRNKNKENFNDLYLISTSHEQTGEFQGHLRQTAKPFVDYL